MGYIVYFVVGLVFTGIMWNKLKFDWPAEDVSTKAAIIASPLLWPLVVLFLLYLWIEKKIS